MVFMTYWFILFSAIFIPIYYFISNAKLKRFYLLIISAIFHTHFAGPAGVIPIIIVGIFSYYAGRSQKAKLIHAAILLNVLSLIFYKYACFFSIEIFKILGLREHLDQIKTLFPAAPPLAISFFTFEFVHYLYDVKKGSKPINSLLDFSLFAIFWPSIVAGPVKRYQIFLEDLSQGIKSGWQDNFAPAILRICSGYSKKIIADNLTLFISFNDESYFEKPLSMRWAHLLAVSMRIYMDFSGYSDLALGFANLLGIKLPENFNWPYVANNLTDFWRRWHISLSSWIRDYVYIPLGGSRHGQHRKVFNGLLAFAICGLWHGAAWNFVLWGLFHGFGLAVSGNYRNWNNPLKKLGLLFDRYSFCSRAFTFLYVSIGWLIFFYPSNLCFKMIGSLFIP